MGRVADSWVVPVSGLMGLIFVVLGICVRGGGCRKALRYYFVPDTPAHLHNGAFALIPLGLAFFLIAVGASIAQSAPPPPGPSDPPAGGAFFGFGVVFLFTGLWWVFRPPRWMKPAWLLAEEQAIRDGRPVPDRRDRPYTPRAWALNWLGLVVGSVVWVALGLPVGALFLGLSTGIALLIANRPKRV
jgi:hypothetical protein